MVLSLVHYTVEDYPLTYSPQDCLEEWCETVGWQLVEWSGNKDIGPLIYYCWCEVPLGQSVMGTIYGRAERYGVRVT